MRRVFWPRRVRPIYGPINNFQRFSGKEILRRENLLDESRQAEESDLEEDWTLELTEEERLESIRKRLARISKQVDQFEKHFIVSVSLLNRWAVRFNAGWRCRLDFGPDRLNCKQTNFLKQKIKCYKVTNPWISNMPKKEKRRSDDFWILENLSANL